MRALILRRMALLQSGAGGPYHPSAAPSGWVSTRRRPADIPAEADCEYWGRDLYRRFAHPRRRYRGISSAVRFSMCWRRTGRLGRQDSNLRIRNRPIGPTAIVRHEEWQQIVRQTPSRRVHASLRYSHVETRGASLFSSIVWFPNGSLGRSSAEAGTAKPNTIARTVTYTAIGIFSTPSSVRIRYRAATQPRSRAAI